MQLEIEQVEQMEKAAYNGEHRLTGKQMLERLGEPVIHPKLVSLAASLRPWGIRAELKRSGGENGRFYERSHFLEVIRTRKPRNPSKDYVGTMEQLKAMIAARDAKLEMYRREAKAAYAKGKEFNLLLHQYLNRAITAEHEVERLRAIITGPPLRLQRGTADMVLHL